MTRDEVLESVADLADTGNLVPAASISTCEKFGDAIRALKSKPPESSPTLDAPPQREVTTDIDRLVDERDALKRQYDSLLAQRDREYVAHQAEVRSIEARWLQEKMNAKAVESERDALKAQLEATERKAAEAIARVEALTAEVKHREWESRGAPMEGEPSTPGASPFDGHPFMPMLGRPTHCGTCGYAKDSAISGVGHAQPPLIEVRVNPAMPPGEAKMVGADGREVRIVGIGDGE